MSDAAHSAHSEGVTVRLPSVLAELAGGARVLDMPGAPTSIHELLDELQERFPVLVRRIRDETGAIRRHVNIYVDGEDVRHEHGIATHIGQVATVQILPSIAGG